MSTARCERCASSESRFQHAQSELRACEKQRSQLQRTLERYQQDLSREVAYRKTTEQQWAQQASEYEQNVLELSRAVESAETRVKQLTEQHAKFVCDIQDRVRRLTADRHTVQQELNRLQADNDFLTGKHTATSAELQNEFINLPDKTSELHELLLKYRDELIAAKIARELAYRHLAEHESDSQTLHKTVVDEKNAEVAKLSQENLCLREQLTVLESIDSELRAERQRLTAANSELSQLSSQCQQLTSQLQSQSETHAAVQADLVKEVKSLKLKVSTLQQDLDNSETVQRDFVKLSQSLQVELEQIRQSETEVRWQHEEDIDFCGRCRVKFSLSRFKHHCRHCGKIFCSDCVSQTVCSGPNRLNSRVCDVCHTLLNRDSAPYFSNHAPSDHI